MKSKIFTHILFFLSINLNSQTWSTIRLENASSTGGFFDIYSSLKIVNGNPAMIYFDLVHRDLVYVRANDPNGTSWGSPQVVDYDGFIGKYCKLLIVNGNPAICYYSETNTNKLKYIRATDANGTSWGNPIILGTVSTTEINIAIINGNPAVSYTAGYSIQFKRANDVNGDTWGTAIGFNFSSFPTLLDFKSVNGNPAICIGENNIVSSTYNLRYLRANDANGTSWPASSIVENSTNYVTSGSIQMVNGNPAIAYNAYNASYIPELKYIRSTDANGIVWSSSQALDGVSDYCNLTIISGKPAIIYRNNTSLKIIKANDVDGSNMWNSPQIIPNFTNGIPTSIEIVNGNPAIAIATTQNSSLKYIRASDSDGSIWNNPYNFEGKGGAGDNPSATMVNGNPAFSYYSFENGRKLKYYRANNPQGTAWGDPVIVTNLGGSDVTESCLRIVNGNPAIIFLRFADFENR